MLNVQWNQVDEVDKLSIEYKNIMHKHKSANIRK